MGKPQRIISGRGRSFMGPEWEQFLTGFAIEHIMNSAKNPHENGIAERAIALIKTAYFPMKSACPTIPDSRLVAWGCMIKNLTPMLGAGVSPAQVMLGRNTLLESLGHCQWVDSSNETDVTHTMQQQVQAALAARSEVILEDARRVVNLGMNRKARVGSVRDFRIDDVVQLYMRYDESKTAQWVPGFRIVGIMSHHVIAERGGLLVKHPKFKVKPHEDKGEIEAARVHVDNEPASSSRDVGAKDSLTQTEILKKKIRTGKQTTMDSEAVEESYVTNVEEDQNKSVLAGINSDNPMGGEQLYLTDACEEFCTAKWILAMSPQNNNEFQEEEGAMNLEAKETKFLSGADMNRITPKYFLKCIRARQAIQKELAGLLKIHNGQSSLELTTDQDIRWKYNRKVHSMVVMKRKSTLEFKARLVLRGDQVSEQDMAFVSAPTACRGSVQALIMMNVIFGLSIFMVDISQAFLQSDELSSRDKMVITVPHMSFYQT